MARRAGELGALKEANQSLQKESQRENANFRRAQRKSQKKIDSLNNTRVELAGELGALKEANQSLQNEINERIAERRIQARELQQLHLRLGERKDDIRAQKVTISELKFAANRLETANRDQSVSLAKRFEEIAVLTRLLEEHGYLESGKFLTYIKSTLRAKRNFARSGLNWLKAKREAKIIYRSGLFDKSWYLSHYPDVLDEGTDPVLHYLLHGAIEGRNPGPGFNSLGYLLEYPDVAFERINPLVHYITSGRKEGRLPMPQGN